MSDATENESAAEETAEKKHPFQRLMDNPWLLLALGLVIPILFYTVWGWIELILLPDGTLP